MPIVYQSAVLFVREMQAARAFYEGLLNQQVALDLGANVGYEAGFALWERAHAASIIYGTDPAEAAPAAEAGPGSTAFELYFETDDVLAVWDLLAQAGVQPVHEIREQPWGQRVFRVYDPDHHIVEFGEPMPAVMTRCLDQGLTVEEVAARTFMPVDIVRQIAASSSG
jgi:catechol 2,3-dioxygenase-like lactoylglutathione lyase family enzyme